ncbi:MAG: hypothetical protein EB069_11635, partial [Actinobacteria bacterium]|nr:hypothetical protein [Actinomycetota bacterium]
MENSGINVQCNPHLSDKEKLAQWIIQRGYATGHGDTIEDLLNELEWQKQEPVAWMVYTLDGTA